MTKGMRIEVTGTEHLREGAVVMVCNHACDADPGVLMQALPVELGFLAAPFMGRLPIFRTLLRWSGSVAIGASRPIPWRDQVRSRLRAGAAFVIFPEGQDWLRAQQFTAPMAAFHPGFAVFAHEARVPVQPLVIEPLDTEIVPFKTSPIVRYLSGNPEELRETQRVMRYRHCVVRVLPRIRARRFVDLPRQEAVPWLLAETRRRMEAALPGPGSAGPP